MTDKKLIALDVDGVLLDYKKGYASGWEKIFGKKLISKNPEMFHAYNEYECAFENLEQKEFFFSSFKDEHWENMPALDGALEACNELVNMGYNLVCVTSMPIEFVSYRKKNLEKLGFPISETYAVGRDKNVPLYNPKKEKLIELDPVAFVDDYYANFINLPPSIHNALIDRNQPDSPNKELNRELANSIHDHLYGFFEFWKQKVSKY
jgi:3-deoxy-D-manno-octulosonate 8-phosphate phosphatase KdsC-like HAD superfamily phosphatase